MFRTATRYLVLPALAAATACLPTARPAPIGSAAEPRTVATNPRPSEPAAVTPELSLGITHTQQSADSWNDSPSVQRAKHLLTSRPGTPQNQHLMGWGTPNPEPSPGVYDWSVLDSRINLIRSTGGTPIITLCGAPDWMKGGRPGETDWTRLEVPPDPEHIDDFAALAAAVAQRYPDVRHFIVWNEMKGFWDRTANRWDADRYIDLYNAVATAVRQVRPDALLGGPYVPADSWSPERASHPSAVRGDWGTLDQRTLDLIDAWRSGTTDADFVVIDGTAARKDGGSAGADPDAKFEAVTATIRERTGLPVWWAEMYPVPFRGGGRDPVTAWPSALAAATRGGASVVLMWEPQQRSGSPWSGLWTDTTRPGEGRPTSLFDAVSPWMTAHQG